ncbi:hypothetical protein ACFL3F_00475 [Planctomycetota bacterium]
MNHPRINRVEQANGDASRGVRRRSGVVLLIVLALLVIMVTLTYQVSLRVVAQRHRAHYRMDYARARYACDSALKLAIVHMEELPLNVSARDPNELDYSDLFAYTEEDYLQLLEEWREEQRLSADEEDAWETNEPYAFTDVNDPMGADPEDMEFFSDESDLPKIRGPYGPEWPMVAEPLEFEIDGAQVTIQIEDENAKYPISWMLVKDPKIENEVAAGFEMFLEWMGYSTVTEIPELVDQLARISELKPFKMAFETLNVTAEPASKAVSQPTEAKPSTGRISRPRTTQTVARQRSRKTVSAAEQSNRQNVDFSRLFNSSLLDREFLARPTVESDTREESALKYIGLWASRQVNINTAPRHVLVAAFMFGGYTHAVDLADRVIETRKAGPIENIDVLAKAEIRYADAIKKSKEYITTTSTVFTIRVTVTRGTARAHAIAAVTRTGDKVRRIAVITG